MKIIIVDDHTLLRRALINMLVHPEMEFVGDYSNGKEFIDSGAYTKADVILMDCNMPVMSGAECCRWLQQNYPDVRVLALSMNDDEMSIVQMIRAGARGYVLKSSEPAALVQAIKDVYENGFHFSDIVSHDMVFGGEAEEKKALPKPNLTKRELEFVIHCCSEMTYKEIADKMNIAIKTVDGHREQLFEKLGIRSRVGLVLFAIREGIYRT